MDSVKADHGFNMDSRSVKNLLQTMSELTSVERREFLQFTTGSPKLPIGGEIGVGSTSLSATVLTLSRLPKLDPHVHRGLQAQRGTIHVGRLPPERHDVRQLPEIARLQQHR